MVKSMNTKIMAALAVFAMAFAGFGAFAGGADGAAADDEETTISVINVDKDVIVTIDMAGVDAYDTVKANTNIYDGADVIVKGVIEGVVYDSEVAIPSYLAPYIVSVEGKPANATLTVMADLASYEGVESQVLAIHDGDDLAFVTDEDTKKTYYGIVTFTVEDAIVGLYDEADVTKMVDDAVAKYKGYLSPEAVEKAKQAAIEEYIIDHPVKKDDTYLYVAIVLAAVIAALVGLMVYDKVVKPKMAKKANPPAI